MAARIYSFSSHWYASRRVSYFALRFFSPLFPTFSFCCFPPLDQEGNVSVSTISPFPLFSSRSRHFCSRVPSGAATFCLTLDSYLINPLYMRSTLHSNRRSSIIVSICSVLWNLKHHQRLFHGISGRELACSKSRESIFLTWNEMWISR